LLVVVGAFVKGVIYQAGVAGTLFGPHMAHLFIGLEPGVCCTMELIGSANVSMSMALAMKFNMRHSQKQVMLYSQHILCRYQPIQSVH